MNAQTVLKKNSMKINELINMSKNDEIKILFENYPNKHDEPVLFDGIITEGDHNILFIL